MKKHNRPTTLTRDEVIELDVFLRDVASWLTDLGGSGSHTGAIEEWQARRVSLVEKSYALVTMLGDARARA